MMKKINNRLIIVFCLLLFTTCKKDHMLDCIKSAGPQTSQIRSIDGISRLHISDNVDVKIKFDSTFKIKVTSGLNLVDGIITEKSGNTLYIRNENKCNWVRSFKVKNTVEIAIPFLDKIDYYGAGDITFMDTLRDREFTFDTWNGSGNITILYNGDRLHVNNNIGRAFYKLAGYAAVNFVYNNDVSVYDASNLIADFLYIGNLSTGNCRVHVNKELEATIKGSGNIYYKGEAYRVVCDRQGSGELIIDN